MARDSRWHAFWSVVGLLVVSRLAGAAPIPHVRSTTPWIASIVSEAQVQSETFGRLVRAIEATDGIVYIEPGTCRHGVHACLSLSVHAGGGFRLLRILIDGVGDVRDLMATIGHELRHALEVLENPAVQTTAAAYNFYAREAPTSRDAFETTEAIRAGVAVANELARSRR